MAGKYQAYPEYKDSGVEWLTHVPAHWQVRRVKHLAQLNPSKSEVRGRSGDEHVSFIPMEAIGEKGELDTSRSRALGEVISGYTYVANGDVMLAKITPCFENGKAAVAAGLKQGVGFATTEVIPVRPNEPEDAKYLYYLLTSMPFKAVAEGSMYGAGGQKRVADSFVAEYHLSAPPAAERTRIAAFLDHETARIDRLIEKQQRLIELLKEKRQGVISHAVTKGLDPNVPMKDSGVEWLGQVPKHWEVLPAKRFFRLVAEPAPANNDYELLSVYTEIGVRPRKELEQKGNKATTTDGYWRVRKGDIIVNKLLAWMGAVGYSDYEGVTSPAYDILRPTKKLNPKLYHYLFRSGIAQKEFKRWSRGIMEMRLRLYFDELGRILMPFPPYDEQNKIVEHIEAMEYTFDSITSKALKQISLLQERRTALISAAIIGKIDVRNCQPNTSTQVAESDRPMAAEQAAEYRV